MEGLALDRDTESLYILVMMAELITTHELGFIDVVEGTCECFHYFSQWSRKQGYQLRVKRGEKADLVVFKYLFKKVVEGNDQRKGPFSLVVVDLKWDVSVWLCAFSNYIQLWRERYEVGWLLYNAKIGV